jgi:cyanate permease
MATNLPLYQVLVKLGASPEDASLAATAATADDSQLATKDDLREVMADLTADLAWRIIVMFGVQTALLTIIMAAFKFRG